MLLLRPFILHAAKLLPTRALSLPLKEAVTKCVNAAVNTIETIHETCRVHMFFRTWYVHNGDVLIFPHYSLNLGQVLQRNLFDFRGVDSTLPSSSTSPSYKRAHRLPSYYREVFRPTRCYGRKRGCEQNRRRPAAYDHAASRAALLRRSSKRRPGTACNTGTERLGRNSSIPSS